MKIEYKGIYKDVEQLPKGELPENATKFKEPNNLLQLSIISLVFIIPAVFLAETFKIGSYLIHGTITYNITLLGVVMAIAMIFPHELLHAICFGKGAKVEMYISPKAFSAFVVSVHPVSKWRFIFLSLFPNLVLGWIPLSIWMILPFNPIYSNHLFAFAYASILFGGGDYMNAYNALRQMPKGSMHQLSGFNSYWYMPKEVGVVSYV